MRRIRDTGTLDDDNDGLVRLNDRVVDERDGERLGGDPAAGLHLEVAGRESEQRGQPDIVAV